MYEQLIPKYNIDYTPIIIALFTALGMAIWYYGIKYHIKGEPFSKKEKIYIAIGSSITFISIILNILPLVLFINSLFN